MIWMRKQHVAWVNAAAHSMFVLFTLGLILTVVLHLVCVTLARRQNPSWSSGVDRSGSFYDEAQWMAVRIRFFGSDEESGSAGATVISVTRFGWPVPVVSKTSLHERTPSSPGRVIIHEDWHGSGAIFVLPTSVRIHWISLFMHLLVWGGVARCGLASIGVIVRRIRNRRRMRRWVSRLCPICKYPVPGSELCHTEQCPECGSRYPE
jgi:hypothetical protein